MKTLDEVITELEDEGVFPDALHYLQTYRADKLEWEQTRQANEERYQEAVKNCERAENKFIARLKELNIGTLNDPLTWQELQKMVGKPIWVEYDDHLEGRKRTKFKDWEVIDCILNGRIVVKGEWDYHKSELGDIWQAYRKERK